MAVAPKKKTVASAAKKTPVSKPKSAAKSKKPTKAAEEPVAKPKAKAKSKSAAKPQPQEEIYDMVPTLADTQKAKKQAASKPVEHFNAKDLEGFRKELLAMRERLRGQSDSMKDAALTNIDDVNPEEDGTDAHMRLVTLQQVSEQSKLLVKIETALHAIEKGTYGICDNCGNLIRKQRLQAQPFTKTCIKCQSEMEKRPR